MGRKGWGAYSIDALAEGTFVADYTGEALSVEEARKRVPAYDQNGLNYVLTTQEFFQEVRRSLLPATWYVVYWSIVCIYDGRVIIRSIS